MFIMKGIRAVSQSKRRGYFIQYYTIALDVGKKFVHSALLDEDGNILPDSFSIFSSKVFDSKEDFLENFVNIIQFNINSVLYPSFKIQHIVFALSSTVWTSQQESLLKRDMLHSALIATPSIQGKLENNCQIHFKEKASLFAIGEHVLRKKEEQSRRVLYLIIGSSLDRAYMIKGKIVTYKFASFEKKKFEQGTIKDYISQKGIIRLAQTFNVFPEALETTDIAKMALEEHPQALKVFDRYGRHLAESLEKTLNEFKPDEIILGGKMALNFPLFDHALFDTLNRKSIQIYPTQYTNYYVFFGISEFIKDINHHLEP